MSIYTAFDGIIGTQLASNKGWRDFTNWIDTLPIEGYRELIHLADHGWSEELDKIEEQLKDALAYSPPNDKTVLTTAKGLLDQIANKEETTVLVITDGMVPSK